MSDLSPDFRVLFETASDLRAVLTPDLRFAAASDAYCRATLIERAAIVGRKLFDVFPDNPDDATATGVSLLHASLDRVLSSRCVHEMPVIKYAIKRAETDGGGFEERYWSTINTPILDQIGEVAWIVVHVEDVTKVVLSQAENVARSEQTRHLQDTVDTLRTTGHFLDALIENLPGMLTVKSVPDAKYVLINRAAEELMGYDRADILGKGVEDFFPPDDAKRFIARDQAVADSSVAKTTTEDRVGIHSKGVRLLRTTRTPILDGRGKPKYLVAYTEDVTENKAIEEQLRHAQKMETVGQLTGGLAHDFNNLLAVIIGNLDYASERLDSSSEEKGYLDRAQSAALRGAELTRQLLAFARRQPLQPQRVDIKELAAGMIKLQSRTLGEAIEIKTDFAAEVAPVMADPSQIESALLNLCVNARDAMPNGGRLTIATANHRIDEDYVSLYPDAKIGDYVMLSVSDTGSGMSPEVCKRAFDPFFTTKGVGEGSGLGLSMIYGFMKQSGGHVSIYSEAGMGTVVRLYLPQAMALAAQVVVEEAAPVPLVDTNHVILAVDDNPEVLRLVVKQLTDFGYRVLEAAHGPDALEILRHSGPIDLLFTDVVMPGGISGVDLARTARRAQPNLRVLFTSGFPDMALNADIAEMGDSIISKPYLRSELAKMLDKVFHQPARMAA